MIEEKRGIIDSVTKWGVERLGFARQQWKTHMLDTEDRRLVSSMLSAVTPSDDPFAKMTADDQMRRALQVGWIFSDIRLFANSFSAAKIEIKRIEGEQRTPIKNHDLELLLENPNDQMDLIFLWQYTCKWLMLSRNGAFWFLAPERGDLNKIAEIWPIPSDRIKPKPDKEKMIGYYEYRLNYGQPVKINPRYVVHFRFPHPFSLLQSDVPLGASILAMETEIGTGSFQKDTYVSGRGMPRSIISVPEEIGERDFISIAAQIREEFEQEQKLIITRAGDIKATTVGFSQREMALIPQREFTRNEIDTIFLGFPLNSSTGEGELRQYYRMFKDEIIHPAHRLIAGQISVQVLKRFYEQNTVAEFEDIRAQDRALNVQERNVYWRVKKLNEARQDLGLAPYEDKEVGDILVPLATDPAYVAMLKGISRTGEVPGSEGGLQPKPDRRRPSPTAAMSETDAPVNQLSDAAKQGMKAELVRWRKVAVKEVKASRNPGLYNFKSEALPRDLSLLIRGQLLECDRTEDAVKEVFEREFAYG